MPEARFHIAHVLPWLAVGGTELATLRIARAVEPHGFASTILCREDAPAVQEFFADCDLPVHTYRAVEPSYRRPRPYLAAAWQLAKELRAYHVDLMHCADVLAAYYTALAGRLANVPVISHVRSRHMHFSLRDQSLLQPVNKWVFVSRETQQCFGVKVPTSRGTVVYDGVSTKPHGEDEAGTLKARAEFGIPAEAPIVGTLARVAPQKDFATLARAARRVLETHPATHFLIVGDNSQAEAHRAHYEEVKRMLDELGIEANFRFTGFRSDTARMLRLMDVFVLCSHIEGLPLVLLEAMAEARPIVATDIGGVSEVIIPEQTGLLHEHEDADGLARAIVRLLDDHSARAAFGERGMRHVQEHFSQERFAADMARLYRGMLSDKYHGRTLAAAQETNKRGRVIDSTPPSM